MWFVGGWLFTGFLFYIVQYVLYFRGVKHTIHCYIYSQKESHHKVAKALLDTSLLTFEEFKKKPVDLPHTSFVLLVVSCILGPIKVFDFIGDVIYFTFRWDPHHDQNSTKNS
jgi:hypothetical protein